MSSGFSFALIPNISLYTDGTKSLKVPSVISEYKSTSAIQQDVLSLISKILIHVYIIVAYLIYKVPCNQTVIL